MTQDKFQKIEKILNRPLIAEDFKYISKWGKYDDDYIEICLEMASSRFNAKRDESSIKYIDSILFDHYLFYQTLKQSKLGATIWANGN